MCFTKRYFHFSLCVCVLCWCHVAGRCCVCCFCALHAFPQITTYIRTEAAEAGGGDNSVRRPPSCMSLCFYTYGTTSTLFLLVVCLRVSFFFVTPSLAAFIISTTNQWSHTHTHGDSFTKTFQFSLLNTHLYTHATQNYTHATQHT